MPRLFSITVARLLTATGLAAALLHPTPSRAQEASLRVENASVVTVLGPAGSSIELLSADALHPQSVWASLTNAIPPIRYADVSSPQTATRFYRVRGTPSVNSSEPQGRPPGFAWVPPGSFTRGSPVTELDRDADEGPQSVVTLTDGFWMSQHEVTQDEFLAVMGSNPSYFKGPNLPVERVGWPDATNYCAKLTALEAAAGRLPPGMAYRLPTEAEWEYACRAGTTTAFAFGPELVSSLANFNSNLTFGEAGKGAALGNTTPVQSYAPNPWGLFDMHGNVWEWCQDFYGLYDPALSTNPSGPESGSFRVIRGGCWADGPWFCRSAYRFSFGPGLWFGSIGFRPVLAKQIPPPPPTPLALVAPSPASLQASYSFSIHLAPLLTLNAPLGSQLRIEWTDSPVDPGLWKPFTNLTVVSNPTRFADLTAPNHSQRRYRLHVIPAEPAGRPQGFVWIPPGTFNLGTPDDEVDHGWEGPQTEVTISSGFWMSRCEVTQKEFHAILTSHKSYWPGDNLPVESLNWHQANDYCTQLTQREREAGTLPAGFVYRLPTEAEWEYACRAGSSTRFSYGDDPLYTQLPDYAWFIGNAGAQTHPVGSKTPNAWGLFDMHGNVWEWCQDWYGAYPGGQATDPRTLIPSFAGLYRTVRGGCWGNVGGGCRSGSRNGFGPDHPYWGIGLRPVLARPLQN